MEKKFIGDRITELRIKKNVSEYQMSLDLGKNKSYIQSISSGRSLPTMENFLEICEYLEVTPCQFFDTALHNLPLYEKAADLLKQLGDEDMIAVIIGSLPDINNFQMLSIRAAFFYFFTLSAFSPLFSLQMAKSIKYLENFIHSRKRDTGACR